MSSLGRFALLLPTILITVVCFVVPLGLIALYSFGSVDPVNFDVYFGWTTQNYRDFASTLYLHTLLRSVFLSVSTTLVCARARLHPRLLHLAPAAAGPAAAARRRDRPVLDELHRAHLLVGRPAAEPRADRPLRPRARPDDGHINILYTPYAIAIGIVYSYLPLMILPIYVSLERIDACALRRGRGPGRDAVAAVSPGRAAARRCRA